MCLVDRDSRIEEINKALADGLSRNGAARKYGFAPATMKKHAKDCLKLRRDESAEERKLARIRAERISGDLSDALAAAHELKARAQAKGDLATEHKVLKEIGRILSLEQKHLPKQAQEMSVRTRFQTPVIGDAIIFPADSDAIFARRFGGIVADSPDYELWIAKTAGDAPSIRRRIVFTVTPPTEEELRAAKIAEALAMVAEFEVGEGN